MQSSRSHNVNPRGLYGSPSASEI